MTEYGMEICFHEFLQNVFYENLTEWKYSMRVFTKNISMGVLPKRRV